MISIYLVAIITTFLAVAVIGAIVLKLLKKIPILLLLFSLFSLPLSYIAFTFIRVPIDKAVIKFFRIPGDIKDWPLWYSLLILLYAPITEELIKLWPLASPWIRKKISSDNKIAIGMMVGLGFGIGELWFVAQWLLHDISLRGVQWYQLWGYIIERLISCFSHGVFTVVALYGCCNRLFKYLLYAVGLHVLSNLPVVLYNLEIIKSEKLIFQNIMMLYLVLFSILLIFILVRFIKKDSVSLNNTI